MQPTNYVSEFDELFERMSRNFGSMRARTGADFPIDVIHHDDELVITADVPGFDASSFDVSVDDDLLTIRAESTTENAEDDAYIRRERRHHTTHRTIRLPVAVDGDDASATYLNGVLTVTIPVETNSDDVHHIAVE